MTATTTATSTPAPIAPASITPASITPAPISPVAPDSVPSPARTDRIPTGAPRDDLRDADGQDSAQALRPLRVTGTPRPQGPAGYPAASTRPGPGVRRVRVGAPGVRRPLGDEDAEPRPLRERAPELLPDPTAQCCAVVRAAVEVLRGERPAAHLARWVTPQVRDQLAERARIGLAHGSAPAGGHNVPVQVRRVRLVRLGDDVAEATVVLDDDGRVRAAAVRLEARRGTWRVAVLEIG